MDGSRVDHDGFGVNYLGSRGITDINLSVKAGLADANGDVYIRGRGLRCHCHKHNCDDQQ